MIKAAIYDMDDLMVNSDPLHITAWEMLLKKYNHTFSELPAKLQSKFIGMRVIDTSAEIIKALKLNVDLTNFYNERIELFLEIIKDKLEALPGLTESLNFFKTNGFKIALASSGTKKYIGLVLEKFKIEKYFDVIVSGDDVKIGKPNPETYRVAVKKLGFKPEECVVLEDAKNGIESAKGANCKCIAIINRHTVPQDHSKADIILNSLLEVTMDKINSL